MAEEHSHLVVTQLYHVAIPYHLDPHDLEFEQNTTDSLPDLLEALAIDYSPDEIRRIMKSVTLLLEKYPHRRLEDAIATAMVWERG